MSPLKLNRCPDVGRNLFSLDSCNKAHDINSPLFFANHPKGIHPETGKLTTFGIPEDGDSGRTYFNGWRSGFWRQHHRREAYVFRQELLNRIGDGSLSVKEAQRLYQEAYDKVIKNEAHLVNLRKKRQIERRAVKEAKEIAETLYKAPEES